ncbi:ciliogenesis-associated TTC17-interacting protein isoform X1 [Serinus canaria]|uniref:ciliogenesis-associated TTC17-interacting protein isoform X1 n=1 Tax=Serinus canaria TaxID=9135 RepID=UPI0021CCE9BD|nr:ciliogenesis-associated TTC17-interacting protein isoform X1 [Serinus canaria]
MESPPGSPQESPSVADVAAEFLSLIGLKELEWCLFAETLAVLPVGASPRDKAQGQWWMAAQWAPYQREGEPLQSCILVQTRFRGKQDGVPVSSTLKAYVTWQLETLEQEEQECLELRPHPTEKTTHFVSHEHGMTVTRTLQEGEAEPRCHSFSYSRARLRGRLLEGASLLLLRVLARRHTMPPSLVFPAINSEGDLCTFSYSALGIQQQAVGSTETEVFVIKRAVSASGGARTVWHCSFLPSGHLAQLMQIDSPVLMLLQDESILSKSGLSPSSPSPKNPWTGRRTWSSTPISWTGRRSCNSPMLPTSSSTPRSGHCYLTSSRHCCSSSHMTPSPLLRNSSPTSGPLGPPLPLLGLLAPSPTPQLATLQLTANKAASTACPVLFALGKLRLREGRWS